MVGNTTLTDKPMSPIHCFHGLSFIIIHDSQMAQLVGFCYLYHMCAAKTKACLRNSVVSPETSLLPSTKTQIYTSSPTR